MEPHRHHHHHHRTNPLDETPPEESYYPQPPQPPFHFADPPPPPNFSGEPPPSFSSQPPPHFHDPQRPPHFHVSPPPPLHFHNSPPRNYSDPPPPPHPPSFYGEEGAPPPPSIHANHSSYPSVLDFPTPAHPPPSGGFDYGAPPSPPHASVQHVSHRVAPHDHPSMASFVHHHTHHASESDLSSYLLSKPSVRVFCKARTELSLAVLEGKVIVAGFDERDEFQHWVKDDKYSTRLKDKEGCPCFALVNKATGLAMKHSLRDSYPVQLIPYDPDTLDESILWTESKDLGDGYRTIRMINNIHLNLDASNGNRAYGGIHDGNIVVLNEWKKADSQRWKIVRLFFLKTNNPQPALPSTIYLQSRYQGSF